VNAFSTDTYTENFSTLLDRSLALLWRVGRGIQTEVLLWFCSILRGKFSNLYIKSRLGHVYLFTSSSSVSLELT